MAFHFPAAAYLSGREPSAAQPEDTGVERRVEAVSLDKVLGAAGSCVKSPGIPSCSLRGALRAALQMVTWRRDVPQALGDLLGLKSKPSGSERQVLSQSQVP